MILDSGTCSIFARANVAAAGAKPVWGGGALRHQSYYGELDFETSPVHPTEDRKEIKTAARIRVQQNRLIVPTDLVVLVEAATVPAGATLYLITRAYHSTDKDTGQLITDLTLEVVTP